MKSGRQIARTRKFRRSMPTNGLPHPSRVSAHSAFFAANLSEMPDSPHFPLIFSLRLRALLRKKFLPSPTPLSQSAEVPMSVDLFKLPGKVAWITGGSKGLGLQMANAL